jgi:hypothetical protein
MSPNFKKSIGHYVGLLNPFIGHDKVAMLLSEVNAGFAAGSLGSVSSFTTASHFALAAGFLCHRFAANAISERGATAFRAVAHTLLFGGVAGLAEEGAAKLHELDSLSSDAVMDVGAIAISAGFGVAAINAWRKVIGNRPASPISKPPHVS